MDKWKIKRGNTVLYKFRTCPLPMITEASRAWMSRHVHYKNRLLSRAGGIDDQPAAYSQAMELIESHG